MADIYDYTTSGGKNVIISYIESLSDRDKTLMYEMRKTIREKGMDAFEMLNVRQLRGKLYEIKITQNRIMYIIADSSTVYFLHICKKQKGKAEKYEIEKALRRAKEAGLV